MYKGTPIHIYLLRHYFEGISIAYHFSFLLFLLWVMLLRTRSEKINKTFIRVVGVYVLVYGFIILYYGPRLLNDEL
jgi:hypothetical protein